MVVVSPTLQQARGDDLMIIAREYCNSSTVVRIDADCDPSDIY
jgi:hypothetical protein